MKEYDLLADWIWTQPSMQKALQDLWASSVEHPNHGWKSTQRQKSLTMELRKGSGGPHSLFAPLLLNFCQDPTGRTVENYIFLPIEKYLSPLLHHAVWHFLNHIKACITLTEMTYENELCPQLLAHSRCIINGSQSIAWTKRMFAPISSTWLLLP